MDFDRGLPYDFEPCMHPGPHISRSRYFIFIVMTLSAQLCHILLLGAIFKVVTNINVPLYYYNLKPAAIMAIATDSSAATLPVTMAAGKTNRLHQRTIDLVFPLGATVNMDGSTIYYVQAVIFMSAISGWSMDFAQQIQVGIVGALICCGAAPIPGGFIVLSLTRKSGPLSNID